MISGRNIFFFLPIISPTTSSYWSHSYLRTQLANLLMLEIELCVWGKRIPAAHFAHFGLSSCIILQLGLGKQEKAAQAFLTSKVWWECSPTNEHKRSISFPIFKPCFIHSHLVVIWTLQVEEKQTVSFDPGFTDMKVCAALNISPIKYGGGNVTKDKLL